MTDKPLRAARARTKQPAGPLKPWRPGAAIELTRENGRSLYQAAYLLSKDTCERVGLRMKVPVFIKDPLTANEDLDLCIREIWVRLEPGMDDGPTSARIAVVDFNADTQKLAESVIWDEKERWFRRPGGGGWLPAPSPDDAKNDLHRQYIDQAVQDPYFHQVNVWAVVQQTLEFYEHPQSLGRPVPWGFDGNRLIVIPHAGYGNNAFYDQHSKSLQFYYFGDRSSPGFACLSHDIVAHETGHAILDGIRPMYNQNASLQTAAFHEFIGDLTAILLTLHNRDVRRFVSATTHGDLDQASILADLARQFGEEVQGQPYLRTAFYKGTLQDVKDSLSHHHISEVMTAAMFDILMGIAEQHLAGNPARPGEEPLGEEDKDEAAVRPAGAPAGAMEALARSISPAQSLLWAADRLRRVALQPLDLCPPCDIQFIDYARAVVRNDILTNPVDRAGYRSMMLDVFHARKLCDCGYKSGQELPDDCAFQPALEVDDPDMTFPDIERISRSRAAAYYFLHDNRAQLRIPGHQDIRIADLYDTNKQGVAAERLPREVVLEYVWQEEITLQDDPARNWSFGKWAGRTIWIDCGGTLVFDERGNLLSWFRKPGTEHLSEEEASQLQGRKSAWEQDPARAKQTKIKPLSRLDRARLDDLQEGQRRKDATCEYLAKIVRRGLIGVPAAENRFSDGGKPFIWIDDGAGLRFEMAAQARENWTEEEEPLWTLNF